MSRFWYNGLAVLWREFRFRRALERRITSFNLLRHTPMDCLNFVAELQEQARKVRRGTAVKEQDS